MIGFLSPWILLGLGALPLIWLVLRAVPPAPVMQRFPAVVLLLGLQEKESEAHRTPWWILLLRLVAVAALIIGFARPILNPTQIGNSDRDLLIVVDNSWASGPVWSHLTSRAEAAIAGATQRGVNVAIVGLADANQIASFTAPQVATTSLRDLRPRPWTAQGALLTSLPDQAFDTLWLASPVSFDEQGALAQAFTAQGDVTVFQPTAADVLAIATATRLPAGVATIVSRPTTDGARQVTVRAIGRGPNGGDQILGQVPVALGQGETQTEVVFDLPSELVGRILKFDITDQNHAAARALVDDSVRRREIALFGGAGTQGEGLVLLQPLHFLRQALVGTADVVEGTLTDVLQASPDALFLTDVAQIPQSDRVLDWVEQGGILVRFAGPRMAAAEIDRSEDDPLAPVRLRAGGRTVGGAMSWDDPKTLREFPADSPFHGLGIPNDIEIRSQLLAEPSPNLAGKVIARLEDGTPLVTRKIVGQGQIVLFHVSANAEWSSLPLSGLFLQMLQRLSAVGGHLNDDVPDVLGRDWRLVTGLTAQGTTQVADVDIVVSGERLLHPTGSDAPAGVYQSGSLRFAKNILGVGDVVTAPKWPASVVLAVTDISGVRDLTYVLLTCAAVLLMIDMIMASWIARGGRMLGVALAVMVAGINAPDHVMAEDSQNIARALTAANKVVLAYVETGDDTRDQISHAGLWGLSQVLFRRTAVEPTDPVGVDLDVDDIAFYPFLYWPITLNQTPPQPHVTAKLNRYLASGGMILFDTLDADIAGYGRATKEGRKLQDIARGLNIPRLAPIHQDHVLTRSFYLIQDAPGRYTGRAIWVEAPVSSSVGDDRVGFRNQNDGVTPVIVGGNDWAAAWAMTADGAPLMRIGRGFAAERQRELSYRFGVNLIMHVLTGNYKSDQVHVPDLLNRLGQ